MGLANSITGNHPQACTLIPHTHPCQYTGSDIVQTILGIIPRRSVMFPVTYSKFKKKFKQKPWLRHTTMPESQHPSTGCFSGSAPINLTTVDELETRNAQPENNSKGNQSDAEDWDEWDLTYSGIPLNICLSRAEETLSCLLNKCGVISGNKVQYSGTMVNGVTIGSPG